MICCHKVWKPVRPPQLIIPQQRAEPNSVTVPAAPIIHRLPPCLPVPTLHLTHHIFPPHPPLLHSILQQLPLIVNNNNNKNNNNNNQCWLTHCIFPHHRPLHNSILKQQQKQQQQQSVLADSLHLSTS